MTQLLKAKPIIDKRIKELEAEIAKLAKTPKLAIILVGEDPASQIYVRNKIIQAKKIGAETELIKLSAEIKPGEFLNIVNRVNDDNQITGALIQLPLPKQLQELDINSLINSDKDVDGFHPQNIAKLYLGQEGMNPCTPRGIITLLDHYNINVSGKNIVIVGRSNIVGKPLFLLLNQKNATTTLCHSKTINLKEYTRRADIIISAVGNPRFLTKEYFRNDSTQVLIDVGMNQIDAGLSGDIDFENVSPGAKAITPVPGGVGPLTILTLLENLIQATKA